MRWPIVLTAALCATLALGASQLRADDPPNPDDNDVLLIKGYRSGSYGSYGGGYRGGAYRGGYGRGYGGYRGGWGGKSGWCYPGCWGYPCYGRYPRPHHGPFGY